MKTKATNRLMTIVLVCAGVVGCATVRKADIPATANPQEEITRLDQDMDQGFIDQYDVLSVTEFNKAQKDLEKAKREQSNGTKQEKVLNRVAIARGHLLNAKEHAEGLQPRAGGIIEARAKALQAGVRNQSRLATALKKQDDDLRSEIESLESGRLSPNRWADLQKGYQDLELKSIQERKLGDARAQIDGARANGAKKNTPSLLRQAEMALQNAANVISTDRYNDAASQSAVERANATAQLLTAVLAATKRPEGVISESAAYDLVKTSRKVGSLESSLDEAEAQTSEQANQLKHQEEQLKRQGVALSLEQALEDARREFKEGEADVYRQGDKLLIRLKSVNFASGRSDIPAASLPVLAKVKTIAEELNPQQIIVEGHTDSTGSAKTNLALSQSRAEAVATYFESNGVQGEKVEAVGYGFKKPLASNKTKAGRAQNRRVDITITPTKPQQPAAM